MKLILLTIALGLSALAADIAAPAPCEVQIAGPAAKDLAAEDAEVEIVQGATVLFEKAKHLVRGPADNLAFAKEALQRCIAFQRSAKRPLNAARTAANWALGDFDGDGYRDAVLVKGTSYSTLLGNAGGLTPFPPVEMAGVGTAHQWVVVADVNGDGKQDLLMCCSSAGSDARIAVALGTGTGLFQPPTLSVASSGGFAVTDWNKDGRPDVIARTPAGTLVAYLGQAGGGFEAGASTSAQAGQNLAIADATGDGIADVIMLDARSVVVHPGQPDGSFGLAYSTDLAWNKGRSLTAADFTGDGKLDLVVTHDFGMSEVLKGDPPSRFSRAAQFAHQSLQRTLALDLNEDGVAELLLPNAAGGGLRIITLDAQGIPTASPLYGVAASTSVYPEYEPTRSASATGDLNGDGIADLVVAATRAESSIVQIYHGGNLSSLAPATPLVIPPTAGMQRAAIFSLSAVEMTTDLRTDLVAVEWESQRVLVYRNTGVGSFDLVSSTPLNGLPRDVLVADFNNDTRADLAVALGGDTPGNGVIRVLYGDGQGGFAETQTIRTGATPHRLAGGDFNGDFKLDLAYIPVSAAGLNLPAGLVLNRTNNEFQQPLPVPLSPYTSIGITSPLDAIVAGDVNGDGSQDLVIAAEFQGGTLSVLLGNGRGVLNPLPVQQTLAAQASHLQLADADEDGNLDIIAAHCCDNTSTRIYFGKADGTFQNEYLYGTGSHARRTWLADLNGDSKPELVSQTLSGVSVTRLRSPQQMRVLSAASGLAAAAPGSIASAYGSKLATTSQSAGFDQFELANTRVTIRDFAGRVVNAPLLYISPGQVNFVVPAGLSSGPGRVTVFGADNTTSIADIPLSRIAPGLFTVDASRLVAANVVRVRSNGQQVAELPFTLQNGVLQGVPIDLGPADESVVMVLYGTGIRGRSSLVPVTVSIGGAIVQAAYAGAQNEFPGLDQVNVTIPRTLAGRGSVEVIVTVEGQSSNAGRILIR